MKTFYRANTNIDMFQRLLLSSDILFATKKPPVNKKPALFSKDLKEILSLQDEEILNDEDIDSQDEKDDINNESDEEDNDINNEEEDLIYDSNDELDYSSESDT